MCAKETIYQNIKPYNLMTLVLTSHILWFDINMPSVTARKKSNAELQSSKACNKNTKTNLLQLCVLIDC